MRSYIPAEAETLFRQLSRGSILHFDVHTPCRFKPSTTAVCPWHRRRRTFISQRQISAEGLRSNTKISHVTRFPTLLSRPASSIEAKDVAQHGFDQILQQAHSERVFCALCLTAEGEEFTRRASTQDFSSALHIIQPMHIMEPLLEVYRYMPSSMSTMPKHRLVRKIEERVEAFATAMSKLVSLRLRGGHALTRADCRHLLHCAKVLRLGDMARNIRDLSDSPYAQPRGMDLYMYNYYMEAICWSNTFHPAEKCCLRVLPDRMSVRSRDERPLALAGHKVGPDGIREESLFCFRQMNVEGLEGDEATFTNLMVAMGREGDLDGVKSILKSVYNIDVDLLSLVDEEETESPTFFEPESPLRPTARLLSVIVHVFASNNQLGTAYKLADYISRYYDLRVPFKVWTEIFDWATIMTKWRKSSERRQGQDAGRVEYAFFEGLWLIATDEPHNIEPDVILHARYTRLLQRSGKVDAAYIQFRFALELFEKYRGGAQALGERLLHMSKNLIKIPSTSCAELLPAKWYSLRQEFVLASLIEDRDLQTLIISARRLLTQRPWSHDKRFYSYWARVFLPNSIQGLSQFLPNTIEYELPDDSHIIIEGLSGTRIQTTRPTMRMNSWNGMLRDVMDREIVSASDLRTALENFQENFEITSRLLPERVRRFEGR